MAVRRLSELAGSASAAFAARKDAAVLSVRPKVADLVFHAYGRSLHPELFEVYRTQRVTRGEYSAQVDVTSAGHVVTWRYQGLTLCEVCTSATQPLPIRRRLMSYQLRGDRQDKLTCRCGVRYRVQFQLEPVEPEVFWTFQRELNLDAEQQGMIHHFDASGRMPLGAISYVHLQSRDRSLVVKACHTFPDDFAIVKTQSVFELP